MFRVAEETVFNLQPVAQHWRNVVLCLSMSADSRCHLTVGNLQIMLRNNIAIKIPIYIPHHSSNCKAGNVLAVCFTTHKNVPLICVVGDHRSYLPTCFRTTP